MACRAYLVAAKAMRHASFTFCQQFAVAARSSRIYRSISINSKSSVLTTGTCWKSERRPHQFAANGMPAMWHSILHSSCLKMAMLKSRIPWCLSAPYGAFGLTGNAKMAYQVKMLDTCLARVRSPAGKFRSVICDAPITPQYDNKQPLVIDSRTGESSWDKSGDHPYRSVASSGPRYAATPDAMGWEERNQLRNADVSASSITSRLRPNYPGR